MAISQLELGPPVVTDKSIQPQAAEASGKRRLLLCSKPRNE